MWNNRLHYSRVLLLFVWVMTACASPAPTPPPVVISEKSSQSQTSPKSISGEPLTLSRQTDNLLSVQKSFATQGSVEDEKNINQPLTLPIVGRSLKQGTGSIHFSNRSENWSADRLTESYFYVTDNDGVTELQFAARKWDGGATTLAVVANGIVPANTEFKVGTSISVPIQQGAQYTTQSSTSSSFHDLIGGSLNLSITETNIQVAFSGFTGGSVTYRRCYSGPYGSTCYNETDPNISLISGQVQLIAPYAPQSLNLKLQADQDGIGNTFASESGELALQSVLGIDTFGSQEPWTLRIKKDGATGTETGDSCWDSYSSGGTGKKDNAYTLDASKLGNGTYTVEAYYSAYPDEKATVKIKVENKALISAIPSSFKPGEEVTTLTTFVPPCTDRQAVILLSGEAWSPLSPTVPEQSCSHPGFSVGPGQQNTVWDGLCRNLAGKGSWTLELMSTKVNSTNQKLAETKVNLLFDTIVPPPPTPTPEPTVEPSVEPSIDPSPSPTASASPSVNPSVEPSPSPSTGPTPSVGPTATPTPNMTPTPTPTPTPSPSSNAKEDCLSRNAGRDANVEALWRWFPGNPENSQPEECYLPPFRILAEHEIEGSTRPECESLMSASEKETCKANTPMTFAPKDRNGSFDKLKFSIQAESESLWKLDLQKDNFSTLDDLRYRKFGSDTILWDGFIGENLCVNDGDGVARLVDKYNILVQEIPFRVDNAPPQVVSGSTLNTVKISEDPERFQTDVVVNLMDFAGGLSEDTLNVRIFVEGVGEIQTKTVTRHNNSMISVAFRFYANADQRYIHMLYEDVLHNIASVNVNQ